MDDRERVAEFHANTLLDIGEEAPLVRLHGFVLDLMSGSHPTSKPDDFTIVEQAKTGRIVSSMCLISQTWLYKGIPFPFGQPDIVSTDPEFRRRGLVRAQMAEIHRWSAHRGELIQGITGIPWYYRQFGYEYALNLEAGRSGPCAGIPAPGEAEPFVFREATLEDVEIIAKLYRAAAVRSLVTSERSEAMWIYDLTGRNQTSGIRADFRIIEKPYGEPVGLLVHSRRLWGTTLGVRLCEAMPDVPFLSFMPSVMRYLSRTGANYAARDGGSFSTFTFNLGERHPAYPCVNDQLPVRNSPYAWFLRAPDLSAFLNHIKLALEKRLSDSGASGFSGELALNFYRSGLRLTFANGRITASDWRPGRVEEGDAAFPELTFLQLLFGYRSLEELQYAFADCTANSDRARVLLPILFPKEESNVWVGG